MTITNKEDFANVSCNITNIGDVSGKEVVQLYIRDPKSTVVKPYKELKDFEKVFLNPKETKRVSFTLEKDKFEYYNTSLHKWIAESGEYEILIGASAQDIRLAGKVYLDGDDEYTLVNVKDVPWQT